MKAYCLFFSISKKALRSLWKNMCVFLLIYVRVPEKTRTCYIKKTYVF